MPWRCRARCHRRSVDRAQPGKAFSRADIGGLSVSSVLRRVLESVESMGKTVTRFGEGDQVFGSTGFKFAGFAARWVRTATNVIRDAENQPPVLFVLDLMLPGIDGFELCQSIRKHELLRELPIVILTEWPIVLEGGLAFPDSELCQRPDRFSSVRVQRSYSASGKNRQDR
jgi:CheY-like chemotaxis protein